MGSKARPSDSTSEAGCLSTPPEANALSITKSSTRKPPTDSTAPGLLSVIVQTIRPLAATFGVLVRETARLTGTAVLSNLAVLKTSLRNNCRLLGQIFGVWLLFATACFRALCVVLATVRLKASFSIANLALKIFSAISRLLGLLLPPWADVRISEPAGLKGGKTPSDD